MPLTEPAPPPARPARWPAVLAWVVILGCVGLIVVAGLRPRATSTLADADPERQASTELLMQSRVAIGLDAFTTSLGAGRNSKSGAPDFTENVDQVATTPLARLRAVPAIAELTDAPTALARLDALRDAADLPETLRRDVEAFRAIYAHGPGALNDSQRASLVARHGWFGRLALSHGLPADDPARRAALAPATRAALTMVAVIFGGIAAVVVGIGLLIWALVAVATGRMRPRYVPALPGRSGPFVEAFAVYLVANILVSLAVALWLPKAGFGANWLVALTIPLAIAWPCLRGLTWAEVRRGFGWHRGRGWLREAGLGVVGYVAALPLVVLAMMLTALLTHLSGVTPTHPITQEAGAGGLLHTLQLYLLAAAYAPVVEETMFRGAFYHHCRRGMRWWLAAAVIGLLFAAIHPQGWVGIPLLMTIAIAFAALREWRGSIVAPMACHACVNAVTVTMLVLTTA